jgi:hypothetical protein
VDGSVRVAETGDVHNNLGRNIARQAFNSDLREVVDDDRTVKPDRRRLTNEGDRDRDLNGLIHCDAVKVHVQDMLPSWVTLDVCDQSSLLLAINHDRHGLRSRVRRKEVLDLTVVQLDGQ